MLWNFIYAIMELDINVLSSLICLYCNVCMFSLFVDSSLTNKTCNISVSLSLRKFCLLYCVCICNNFCILKMQYSCHPYHQLWLVTLIFQQYAQSNLRRKKWWSSSWVIKDIISSCTRTRFYGLVIINRCLKNCCQEKIVN